MADSHRVAKRLAPLASSSYELVTHDHFGGTHVHVYTPEQALVPGSIVVRGGRYWIIVQVEQRRAEAQPARYRLTLRHPEGRTEAGAIRRFHEDAPRSGHQLATVEEGNPISWTVVEETLAFDESGQAFLESIAERDYQESDSLPDHQLEHTVDRRNDDIDAAAAMLARAEEDGLAVELVGLDAGQAPDWIAATHFLDSLVIEEIEDDLLVLCGVDPRHHPQDVWLDIVKQRLGTDLANFRTAIENGDNEIEEWDFGGGRVFAASGSFDDDSNPDSGYGWICRLVDASVLQAAGLQRIRKARLLP
jgi:hypothetical protein